MGPDGATADVSALANTRAASDQVGSDGDSKPTVGMARALHATAWLSESLPSARMHQRPPAYGGTRPRMLARRDFGRRSRRINPSPVPM